jgi:hypothetical protein
LVEKTAGSAEATAEKRLATEDCGSPENFMARRNDKFLFDALEDLDTMVEVHPAPLEGGSQTSVTPYRRSESCLLTGV